MSKVIQPDWKSQSYHEKKFNDLLKGKKIKKVEYLSEELAEEYMFYKRPLQIIFTDGSVMCLQSDDEGNDGGAAWYGYWDGDEQKETVIYTI